MKLGGWVVMLSAMIMFLTFMGLPTGLDSILTSMGVTTNSTTSAVISADVEQSSIWGYIFGTTGILVLIIGTGVGSVLIGLFGKGYDVSLVYAPFIVAIAGVFVSTFWGIIVYVKGFEQLWMTSIIALIFGVLGLGFAMSCLDYFGGR